MAIIAYTLLQVAHFADMLDGDVTGGIDDVLVLDTVENLGIMYDHATGLQLGTPFPFTSAHGTALITAGWLAANPTFTDVPAGKAGLVGATGATGGQAGATGKTGMTGMTGATGAAGNGYTAATGWTATSGVTAGSRLAFTSGASTLGATAIALAALISDLTAAGIIGA